MIETSRTTGKILQVGSQRVSSVIYAKAKELLAAGAIGKLNMVSGALGPQLVDGRVELHGAAGCVGGDVRLAAVSGDCAEDSVQRRALFPVAEVEGVWERRGGRLVCAPVQRDALHYGLERADAGHGDGRIALLERWARCADDVMLGLFDYPEGFNLSLRVNFVDGGEESEGFLFAGSEGTMEIDGNTVSVNRVPRERSRGYTIGHVSRGDAEGDSRRVQEEVSA